MVEKIDQEDMLIEGFNLTFKVFIKLANEILLNIIHLKRKF